MFKKVWNDPVGSKVISSFIITILGSVVVYLFGLWPLIKSWTTSAFTFLGESANIPHWLLIVLVIPALIICWVLILALVDKRKGGIDFTNYVSDSFLGLHWRWQHGNYGIWNIHCLCPKCEFQIIPVENSGFGIPSTCNLNCENCGYTTPSYHGSYRDMRNHIELKIQHKLRTGKWVESL